MAFLYCPPHFALGPILLKSDSQGQYCTHESLHAYNVGPSAKSNFNLFIITLAPTSGYNVRNYIDI